LPGPYFYQGFLQRKTDSMKTFRTNGAIGAILDEYEKALEELIDTIQDLSPLKLATIVDTETEDPDCRSIQTILGHVIRAGHNYVIVIRKGLGEEIDYHGKATLNTVEENSLALKEMFAFNEKLFQDYPNMEIEEQDPNKKMLTMWGQRFDVEQLFEHAIVHILRHRRQIEKFKIKLT